MEKQPLVSIFCICYNQKDYIKDCLDGFLIQKTDFKFEVLIHDDASTDGTDEIIRDYCRRYPDFFRPVYQSTNQFSQHKGIVQNFLFPIAKGKYLSYCEGDDYWTNPEKLQIQCSYLEQHPDCSLCYGKVMVFMQESGEFAPSPIGVDVVDFNGLLESNHIPTASVMLRKDMLAAYYNEIHPENYDWKMGDYPAWLYFCAKSKIHFFDEVFGVYRHNISTVSHPKSIEKMMEFLDSRDSIISFFGNKFNVDTNNALSISENERLEIYSERKEYVKGFRAIRSLKHLSLKKRISHSFKFIKKILGQIFPKK